jgi:hypothetical protein
VLEFMLLDPLELHLLLPLLFFGSEVLLDLPELVLDFCEVELLLPLSSDLLEVLSDLFELVFAFT